MTGTEHVRQLPDVEPPRLVAWLLRHLGERISAGEQFPLTGTLSPVGSMLQVVDTDHRRGPSRDTVLLIGAARIPGRERPAPRCVVLRFDVEPGLLVGAELYAQRVTVYSPAAADQLLGDILAALEATQRPADTSRAPVEVRERRGHMPPLDEKYPNWRELIRAVEKVHADHPSLTWDEAGSRKGLSPSQTRDWRRRLREEERGT